MKGITEHQIFGPKELLAFAEAQRIVAALPEEDTSGELLRCHEIARVVGRLLNLKVIDGRYEYGCEHSWCVITEVKYRGFTILDPYAIGRIPPVQLVSVLPTIPNRYFPEDKRKDIRGDVIEHLLGIVNACQRKQASQ